MRESGFFSFEPVAVAKGFDTEGAMGLLWLERDGSDSCKEVVTVNVCARV